MGLGGLRTPGQAWNRAADHVSQGGPAMTPQMWPCRKRLRHQSTASGAAKSPRTLSLARSRERASTPHPL